VLDGISGEPVLVAWLVDDGSARETFRVWAPGVGSILGACAIVFDAWLFGTGEAVSVHLRGLSFDRFSVDTDA
jgi:hypothetical protein